MRFYNEKNIFARGIQSNFVVRLIGIVNSHEPLYVVMELMDNGDLKSFLMNAAPLSDEVSQVALIVDTNG